MLEKNTLQGNYKVLALASLLEKNVFYWHVLDYPLQILSDIFQNHSPGNYGVHQKWRTMVYMMIFNFTVISFLFNLHKKQNFVSLRLFSVHELFGKIFLVIFYKGKTMYYLTLFFFYKLYFCTIKLLLLSLKCACSNFKSVMHNSRWPV